MNLSNHSIKVTNFAFLASGVISEINLSYYLMYKKQDLGLPKISTPASG